MKNLILTLCILLGTISVVISQSYEGKGDHKINIGYELYGYGNGIKATFDYGLSDLFSIGVGASAFLNNGDNDYFIYARTNIHLGIVWDLPPKLDIYPGIELGYLSRQDIGYSGYLGLRYFVTKKLGLFAEIGNNGAVGLSIKV